MKDNRGEARKIYRNSIIKLCFQKLIEPTIDANLQILLEIKPFHSDIVF